jgi:hypothetical protein
MARLDDVIWRPSALGVQGPRGFLGAVRRNAPGEVFYGPLYDWALTPPRLPTLNYTLDVVEGASALSRIPEILREIPELARPGHHTEWLGVVATTPGGAPDVAAFIVAHTWESDPRIANVRSFWVEPSRRWSSGVADVQLMSSIGFLFIHALARKGFVAMVTTIETATNRKSLIGVLSTMRPLAEVLSDRGLISP